MPGDDSETAPSAPAKFAIFKTLILGKRAYIQQNNIISTICLFSKIIILQLITI